MGVNRADCRFQPKQFGATLVQRASVWISADLTLVVPQLVHFDFLGWSFKQNVHLLTAELKVSANHETLWSAKLDQARFDGEPHNPTGSALAPSVKDERDQFPERQWFLLAIGFHGLNSKPGNGAGDMGCSPQAGRLWRRVGFMMAANHPRRAGFAGEAVGWAARGRWRVCPRPPRRFAATVRERRV
jgi:hypothetical protein